MDGGSVNNQILTLVQKLMHLLWVTLYNQEAHKEKSTLRRSVWSFGFPCASSTHGTWGTLYITTPTENSDSSSS